MNEETLERVMLGFWEKEFDVLVSTTIVESGLDIPNANTLIVERADMFGLSQLHQIRGRVGRGRERAYAYFLYPPEKPLTETAHDRLATIAQNTDLGAGMAVAMKDLEIRGAGNLLGGEQSGHIASVGFDLYVRLVGEAVAEFKGEKPEVEADVKVDLPVDANLPHDYIPGERLRLEAYRKLAAIHDGEGLDAVRAEIVDRYGPVPQPVENLFAVAAFRVKARKARADRGLAAGQERAVRADGAAGEQGHAAAAAVPGCVVQERDVDGDRAAGRPPPGSAASRSGTPRCSTGPRGLIDAFNDQPVAAR